MKKLDVAHVAQVLANISVIAGIVFLTLQLRQNNALLGAQTRASRTQIRLEALAGVTNNPALAAAFVKQRDDEPLTPAEDLILQLDATVTLLRWQYVYGEFQRGLIDKDDVPVENWRTVYSNRPQFKTLWQRVDTVGLRPDFVQWMRDNVIDLTPR